MAATSLLGLDYKFIRGQLLAYYRGVVRWPGEPWSEPTPTGPNSSPVDWIYPVILRSESRAFNVQNQQERDIRVAVYGAFQPDRGGFVDRLDAVHTDLLDALSLTRSSAANTFDGSFSFVGESAPPSGLELSHRWLWYAWLLSSMHFEQVA